MIARLFRKRQDIPSAPIPALVDTKELDESFQLLKRTATQVSCEASKTAKALAEQQSRINACFTALNSASDIIFITDRSQKVYFCNDQFVHHYGYKNYDDVVGKHVSDVIPDISSDPEMLNTVSHSGIWQSKCSGSCVTVVPMMNGQSEPVYYVYTFKICPRPETFEP